MLIRATDFLTEQDRLTIKNLKEKITATRISHEIATYEMQALQILERAKNQFLNIDQNHEDTLVQVR